MKKIKCKTFLTFALHFTIFFRKKIVLLNAVNGAGPNTSSNCITWLESKNLKKLKFFEFFSQVEFKFYSQDSNSTWLKTGSSNSRSSNFFKFQTQIFRVSNSNLLSIRAFLSLKFVKTRSGTTKDMIILSKTRNHPVYHPIFELFWVLLIS